MNQEEIKDTPVEEKKEFTVNINGKEFTVDELQALKRISGGNIEKYLKRQEFLEKRLAKKKSKNRAKNKVARQTRKSQRQKKK